MLASLELFGFKSFADRTTFQFAPGVTAVVGPNGSGKSNVVDAIKWVLGDQSAKSLRGKEMTDVIFNGATGRKPNNFAEATLAFDNRSGFLPTRDSQVRVGRRLWRNGDSEYLLNDQVVRLKDVRDLFLGTGASAYAIIEQGRVDQILQANAVGRRAVFEEAAGISRYKGKRVDALRRLERVEQNLLRLTDIVDEVESQLHATRTQAVKAAKHREVSKEHDRWWLGLAADDFRHISAQLTTLESTLAEQQEQLDALAVEQAALDEELSGLDAKLARADEERRSAEKRSSSAREAIAGHEAAAKYQVARLEELEGELVRLRRQLTLLSVRATEATTELDHNARVLASSEADLAARQAALRENGPELEDLIQRAESDREQVAKDRQLQLERLRQVSDAEKRIAGLAAERDGVTASMKAIEVRLAAIDQDVADAESLSAERALAVEEAEAAVRVRNGRTADLYQAREKLARDRESLAAEIAAFRERKSATSARVAVLADLQERGEGFGIGVREILRRARSLGDAPWNRIYGTVADLLDVDLDEAPLLEVALGERAQFIVIDDFESLIPYLERSSAKLSGRVGFLSNRGLPQADEPDLTGVRYIEAYPKRLNTGTGAAPRDASASTTETEPPLSGGPRERHDLRGLPGVLRRADELVRPSSRMPHLATRLLSGTWVVDSLAAAIRLARGFGRDMRFVTLSGELLDADGTLVVGPLRAESAVVSRRSELHRLRAELADIEIAIETAANRQDTLAASQASLTATLSIAEGEVRTVVDRLNRAKAEQAESHRRHQQLTEARVNVAGDLDDHAKRYEDACDRIRKAGEEREAAAKDLETLETGLSLALAGIAEIERRQSAIEKRQASERLEFAKSEERLANLREAVGRLDRESRQRTAQLAEAARRLDVGLDKRSEITRHLLNTQSLLAEAVLELESLSTSVRRAIVGHDTLKRRRAEFANRESQLRSRRRTAIDARHAAELSDRELRQRLATLSERIREDYGREVQEIASEDHSAISLWIAEREGRTSGEMGDEDISKADDGSDQPPASKITLPPFAELRPELEAIVERLRKKLKMMGAVNTDSLADLDELEERHSRLSGQLQDLVEAKRTLEDVIRRINAESKRLFAETFESIREHFRDLFRKLFGGGEGDIVLEDANDILECGIDIVVRPPGKELRSLSLLSGGEKTMTCVGLLLAIFKSRPSPFCILDEVDAALDEANIGRFVNVLKEFKTSTQFIMITHRKPSMCEADVLYGVTMEQAGVSKRLNVRFDDVADDGSFVAAKRAA
ncbi:MAG: AAA family ATPase [Planctomycetaceae bacterium]|nr:AAA family ATPase [Planctomycetaceae bacterium]